jgi:hypothetical protein
LEGTETHLLRQALPAGLTLARTCGVVENRVQDLSVHNLIAYGTDTSVDRFYGGVGDDTAQSRDVPAAKDRVDCGAGIDHVYADKADVVSSDCEKVRVW